MYFYLTPRHKDESVSFILVSKSTSYLLLFQYILLKSCMEFYRLAKRLKSDAGKILEKRCYFVSVRLNSEKLSVIVDVGVM